MAEQTVDKVKFDKEEDIKPLLTAFRKIFEPITKSMQSIALIPEEIKRIADNISQDVESGVPKRVADGVEKLTTSEIDQKIKDAFRAEMSEEEIKQLEKQTELLQVLLDQGIPAKLDDDNKLVKLTEKEITESRKEFITEKSEQKNLENKIEIASKAEGSDGEQQATKIQELQQQLEKSIEKTSELETTLGSRTPQEIQQQEGQGFQAPAFLQEPLEMGKEQLFAIPNAVKGLKQSFETNISGPLMSLININKKHHKVMEGYGETGEKADKLTILKFMAIAAGIAGILAVGSAIMDYLNDDEEERTHDDAEQAAYNKAMDEGKSEEEALILSQRAKQDKLMEEDGLFGSGFRYLQKLNRGTIDITDENQQSFIDQAKMKASTKNLSESAGFKSLTGGSDFRQGNTVNIVKTGDQNAVTTTEFSGKPGASDAKTVAQG